MICGTWVALYGHVYGYVITSGAVQFVITYSIPEVSFLTAGWVNMILDVLLFFSLCLSLCALCIFCSAVHDLNILPWLTCLVSMNMISNFPIPSDIFL